MERELIAELAAILGSPDPARVPCGIGDDTALLSSPGSGGLLLTTDSQREGVHFTWDWIAPESVGYRLVVANV
ncbi:Thiamine-monophosphate kinase, partial [mine drainage metagenome]